MEDLKRAVEVLKVNNNARITSHAEIASAIDTILDVAERVLAVEGKGILPERKNTNIPMGYAWARGWNAHHDQTKINMAANQNDYTAWCPKCFDALDCTGIKDEKGMVVEHEYHCFGCDEIFVLERRPK